MIFDIGLSPLPLACVGFESSTGLRLDFGCT